MPATSAPRAKLPPPAIYEDEYRYWPWGEVLEQVTDWIARNAARGAHLIDYMCGTGYLLNRLHVARPDLSMEGCDIDERYVAYGRDRYAGVVRPGDALVYRPSRNPDVALCTAGLHHVSPEEQRAFITKVGRELRPGGVFLVAEEVLSEYDSEEARRRAVLTLNNALMLHAMERSAPESVIEAAADVLVNDLLLRGEFKRSLSEWRTLLSPSFLIEEERYVWPATDALFGDVILVCRRTDASS